MKLKLSRSLRTFWLQIGKSNRLLAARVVRWEAKFLFGSLKASTFELLDGNFLGTNSRSMFLALFKLYSPPLRVEFKSRTDLIRRIWFSRRWNVHECFKLQLKPRRQRGKSSRRKPNYSDCQSFSTKGARIEIFSPAHPENRHSTSKWIHHESLPRAALVPPEPEDGDEEKGNRKKSSQLVPAAFNLSWL